jgi:hypothetical protein
MCDTNNDWRLEEYRHCLSRSSEIAARLDQLEFFGVAGIGSVYLYIFSGGGTAYPMMLYIPIALSVFILARIHRMQNSYEFLNSHIVNQYEKVHFGENGLISARRRSLRVDQSGDSPKKLRISRRATWCAIILAEIMVAINLYPKPAS